MQAQPGTLKGYGLVRDKDGNPVFDDYFDISPHVVNALTDKDWEHINEQRELTKVGN